LHSSASSNSYHVTSSYLGRSSVVRDLDIDVDGSDDNNNHENNITQGLYCYRNSCDGMYDDSYKYLEVDKENDINLHDVTKNMVVNSTFGINLKSNNDLRQVIIRKGNNDSFTLFSKNCCNFSSIEATNDLVFRVIRKPNKATICGNCFQFRRNSTNRILFSKAVLLKPVPLVHPDSIKLLPPKIVFPTGPHYHDLCCRNDIPKVYDSWNIDTSITITLQVPSTTINKDEVSKTLKILLDGHKNNYRLNRYVPLLDDDTGMDMEYSHANIDREFVEDVATISKSEWFNLIKKSEDSFIASIESNAIRRIAQLQSMSNKLIKQLDNIYYDVHKTESEHDIKISYAIKRNLAITSDTLRKNMKRTLINGASHKKNNGKVKKETLDTMKDLATSMSYSSYKAINDAFPLIAPVTIKRKLRNQDRFEHNYHANIKNMVIIISDIKHKMVKKMVKILTHSGTKPLDQKGKSVIASRCIANMLGTVVFDGTSVEPKIDLDNRIGQSKGIADIGGCLSLVTEEMQNIKEKKSSNVKLELAVTKHISVNMFMPAEQGSVLKFLTNCRHVANETSATIKAQHTNSENALTCAGFIVIADTGDNLAANVAAFRPSLNVESSIAPTHNLDEPLVARKSLVYRKHSNVFDFWLPITYFISDLAHVLKAIVNAIQNHEETFIVMHPLTRELDPIKLNYLIDVVDYFESQEGNHAIIKRLRIKWAYKRKETSASKMNVSRAIMLLCSSHEVLWISYIVPFLLELKKNNFEGVDPEMIKKMIHCLKVISGWFELARRIEAWFDEANGRNVPLSKALKFNVKISYNSSNVSESFNRGLELHRYITEVRTLIIERNATANLANVSLSTVTYDNLTLHIFSKNCLMKFLCKVFPYNNWCHKNFGVGDIIEQLFAYIKYLACGPLCASIFDRVVCKVMSRQVHKCNQLNSRNFQLNESTRREYATVGTGNSNGSDDDTLYELVRNYGKKNNTRDVTKSSGLRDVLTIMKHVLPRKRNRGENDDGHNDNNSDNGHNDNNNNDDDNGHNDNNNNDEEEI